VSDLTELLDELEGIQSGYEMCGSVGERRDLDRDRAACRAKIQALFAPAAPGGLTLSELLALAEAHRAAHWGGPSYEKVAEWLHARGVRVVV